MKQLLKIFKKVGGAEILRRYWRAHILLFALLETAVLGFSKKSLEIVRLAADNRILGKLRRKYRSYISEYLKNEQESAPRVRSDKVWVLWLQGIENAPKIVSQCVHSLEENLKDRELIILTKDNYQEYVQFPDYIQRKIDEGKITATHMSDLLRLELLIRYGGTWIDATVYCSGTDYPDYLFDSDLFVFQTLKPGLDGQCARISSWLMTACTNHPILCLTRALLYEYWSSHDRLIDYFLLHDFFELAIEAYPEEWKKVMPFSNSTPHILLLRLFEQYDADLWRELKRQTAIHKMTYKFDERQTSEKGTYYSQIFGEGV